MQLVQGLADKNVNIPWVFKGFAGQILIFSLITSSYEVPAGGGGWSRAGPRDQKKH